MFTHSACDHQGIRTSVPERKKTVSFEYVLGLNNVTSKAQVLWHFLYTRSYKVRNHEGQFHKSWFKRGSTTLVKNKGPTQGQGELKTKVPHKVRGVHLLSFLPLTPVCSTGIEYTFNSQHL